jgi:dienelactone hydrolase
MRGLNAKFLGLRICGLALLAVHASTSALSSDRISFSSATFSDLSQAAVGPAIDKVQISGELRFPANVQDHLPAIIIAHTIGGFNEANEGWFAAELRKVGFATLTYDSFASRKWPSKTAGGDARVNPSVLADAFAALKFLSAQPKIDPTKIAIVGFSLGGDVAHMTAFERFRGKMGAEQRFAAHVGFYPGWTMGTLGGANAYTGAPVLLLFGDRDELTPRDKVQNYLAYLKNKNSDGPIVTITYANAYHGWTNPKLPAPHFFPDFGSSRKCPTMLVGEVRVKLLIDGNEKNFDRDLWDRCLSERRGYTIGFSSRTRAKSLADSIEFLRKSMKL